MVASLAVALLLATLCAGDPIHLPITRRSSRVRTAADHFAAGDNARARYSFPASANLNSTSKRMLRRASSDGLAVVNQEADSSYFSTLQIGTPGQSFNVILDTGSSDLFVLDSNCRQCVASATLFDSSKSSTFNQKSDQVTEITYGSGSVQGFVSTDTVSMGSFTMASQGFLLVEALDQGLVQGSVSGLIGLAFQGLAETQAVPFWQALVNNNQLSSPEMAFQLTRSQSANDEPGGTFTLGGTNSSLFSGNIEFTNLAASSTPTFWLLSVAALTVQGKAVSIPTGNAALAAIDTGTTALGGPTDAVNAIWAAVPGASSVEQGFFQFPCSTSVQVTLSFGGTAWPINSDDMNLGPVRQGSSMCVGAIFDLTNGGEADLGAPSWVIGDTFLKNVYSVFRQSPMSVGFAQLASDAASGSVAPSAPASIPGAPPIPSAGTSASLSKTAATKLTLDDGNHGTTESDHWFIRSPGDTWRDDIFPATSQQYWCIYTT
ncbi:acid protease [Mycena belliarum]|uniref:Acid protease n=1 Tax=Mycena belliarum TaxID=1033014 RepID=A0AAD6XSU4_9AGAR|nr:acid protease [Mycena belliae]